jgi:drug/metabolite transporter (DMT)-like permease
MDTALQLKESRIKLLATLSICATIFFWGTSSSSIKTALRDFPPFTLAFLRFIIASSILYIIYKKREEKTKIDRKDFYRMALCGFVGVTLYFIFENSAINLTSASNASLLLATIPVLTILFDRFVYKTKFPIINWVGTILSMIGVYFVIAGSSKLSFGSDTIIGNLLMLGASLCWVIYAVLQKPFKDKYSGLAIVTYQNIFGTIFLFPFALGEYKSWGPVSVTGILNVFYLAIFCSALGYFLYIFALNNLGITTTNVYINLLPVVGAVTAYIILKDTFNFTMILGALVIVVGIIIVNIKTKSKFLI